MKQPETKLEKGNGPETSKAKTGNSGIERGDTGTTTLKVGDKKLTFTKKASYVIPGGYWARKFWFVKGDKIVFYHIEGDNYLISAEDGKLIMEFPHDQHLSEPLTFSSDMKTVMGAFNSREWPPLYAYDLTRGEQTDKISFDNAMKEEQIYSHCSNNDGKFIYVKWELYAAKYDRKTMERVWKTTGRSKLRPKEVSSPLPMRAIMIPFEDRLIVLGRDRDDKMKAAGVVLSKETGKTLAKFQLPPESHCNYWALNESTGQLYMLTYGKGGVPIITCDLRNGYVTQSISPKFEDYTNKPKWYEFCFKKGLLISGHEDLTAHFWDLSTLAHKASIKPSEGREFVRIRFGNTGNNVAICDSVAGHRKRKEGDTLLHFGTLDIE